MSYDEFNDSPFDLDHDGNIDPSEASYIEDTIYGDDSSLLESDGDDLFGGYVAGKASEHEERQVLEDKKAKEQMEQGLSDFVTAMVILVIIVAFMAFVGLAIQ